MMDYTIKELEMWTHKIESIVDREGLDCFLQEFEICSYEDMLCYEAYVGMPSHYPHWSYGKAYERSKTLYSYNLKGLAYEMVINSDPCLAYLMKDNTLLLQILTIAHVYGHNDFFKNNRLFKDGTRADYTFEMFKNHANRVRNYIKDTSIGYERVERILDAAHAIKFQTARNVGVKEVTEAEKKKQLIDRYYAETKVTSPLEGKKETPFPDVNRIPLEPMDDLMEFIIDYGNLEGFEKDIMRIVKEETSYFIPQIETKIMNEGWASYWHYQILNQLDLSPQHHMEFLGRHNQVVRPFKGSINPYYMGFKIFKDIEARFGREKIFEVREMERDQSFIRKYLTKELCEEMNLFQYDKRGRDYVVVEVADEVGWKEIRNIIANQVGMGGVPYIKVMEYNQKEGTLILEHQFDGRELEFTYAYETLKYVGELWGNKVSLKTKIGQVTKNIVCDENKKITIHG